MAENWKKATKGVKLKLEVAPGKVVTFTAGGRKRALVEAEYTSASFGEIGFVIVNGEVELADGTKAWALLEIDESSSGEHSGTGILVPAKGRRLMGIAWQDDPNFLQQLGKTKKEVYPYRYRYQGEVRSHDHHVDPDTGWSR